MNFVKESPNPAAGGFVLGGLAGVSRRGSLDFRPRHCRARDDPRLQGGVAALAVLAVIAAADYVYQRQRFLTRHRMSRQELRDEMKQSEGDPGQGADPPDSPGTLAQADDRCHSRGNCGYYQSDTLCRRIEVRIRQNGCRFVAKGVDHLALTIRKVAEENGVPIVENPRSPARSCDGRGRRQTLPSIIRPSPTSSATSCARRTCTGAVSTTTASLTYP
jgi:hypothetical protein